MSEALSPNETAAAIKKAVRMNMKEVAKGGKRKPLFVWGPPGVGKSSIFEQVCEAIGWKLIDVRLTQMEPTDLRGIPVPVSKEYVDIVSGKTVEDVVVRWAIPEFLPKITSVSDHKWDGIIPGDPKKYKGAIILLDELPNAAPSVQAGSYQLVLDGQIGEYIVPENCVVFAAGNRQTDKGGTYKMPTPLMNRFDHIEFEAVFKEWQRYAIKKGYNEQVVGFLSAFEGKLFEFQANKVDGGFPTPRSWELVSAILNDEQETTEKTSMRVVNRMIIGAIGKGVAAEFIHHCETAGKLPDTDLILDGKIKTLDADMKDVPLTYTLTIRMLYKLKNRFDEAERAETASEKKKLMKQYNTGLDNFFTFMMKNFKNEMNVLGARMLLHEYGLDVDEKDVPSWDVFITRFQDEITEA